MQDTGVPQCTMERNSFQGGMVTAGLSTLVVHLTRRQSPTARVTWIDSSEPTVDFEGGAVLCRTEPMEGIHFMIELLTSLSEKLVQACCTYKLGIIHFPAHARYDSIDCIFPCRVLLVISFYNRFVVDIIWIVDNLI